MCCMLVARISAAFSHHWVNHFTRRDGQADLQVVVVGVLCQSAVEEGPGEVVNGILLAANAAVDDLCHHVVMQEVVQVALHREGLKEELLVVPLARRMTHQHTPAETYRQYDRMQAVTQTWRESLTQTLLAELFVWCITQQQTPANDELQQFAVTRL